MSSNQPIIKVEHISHSPPKKKPSSAPANSARSASSSPAARGKTKANTSSAATDKEHSSSGSGNHSSSKSSKSKNKSSPQKSKHLTPSGALGESSLGAKLNLNLNIRRKSSPCIGDFPQFRSSKSSATSPSKSSKQVNQGPDPHKLKVALDPLDPGKGYTVRRRLSSPPSFEPNQFQPDFGSANSSGSNHSSGQGSLQLISIEGLNASSTDIRENTVRSGHQAIQTLYAPNNVVYPEQISINLCNAPDNSTVQCDCGHINCPLCNLMMNLEMTDPTLLS